MYLCFSKALGVENSFLQSLQVRGGCELLKCSFSSLLVGNFCGHPTHLNLHFGLWFWANWKLWTTSLPFLFPGLSLVSFVLSTTGVLSVLRTTDSSGISMSSEFISDTIGVGSGKVFLGAIGCSSSLSIGSISVPKLKSFPSDRRASIAILVSSLVAGTSTVSC